MRKSKPVVATSMYGKNKNVERTFQNYYENLYNSVDVKEDMSNLFKNVNN